jgi:hypothetical protein
MLRPLIGCLSLLLLLGAFPVSADEVDGPEPGGTPQRRTRSAPAPAPAPAPGGEYEFRFHKNVGIGVQVEGSTGLRNMVALVPIFIHPWKGLRLTVGGGAVLDRDNDHEALLRVGAGYYFDITENIFFGPEYNADLEGGTDASHLFGVRLGYQF